MCSLSLGEVWLRHRFGKRLGNPFQPPAAQAHPSARARGGDLAQGGGGLAQGGGGGGGGWHKASVWGGGGWQGIVCILHRQAGNYTFTWSFSVTMKTQRLSLSVWDLRITGVEGGAVVQCKDCPAGAYCPAQSTKPLECPSGQISAARATQCERCPDKMVAPRGANECRRCDQSSKPSASGDWCIPECSLVANINGKYWEYDLIYLDRSVTASLADYCEAYYGDYDDTIPGCSDEYEYHLQLCSSGEAENKACAEPGHNLVKPHTWVCAAVRLGAPVASSSEPRLCRLSFLGGRQGFLIQIETVGAHRARCEKYPPPPLS